MSTNQKVTSLGVMFDASQVAPQQAMEAVPAGWYPVIISDGEVTVNDGGAGRRMALEFTITDGPYKGRKIFDGLNYVHSNPQAQQIAQGQLSAICHAVSVFQIQDVSQLFGKPFQIKVDVEGERYVDADNNQVEPGTPNAKKYDAKNRLKAAKAGAPDIVATPPGAAAPAKVAAPAPTWAANGAAPASPATPTAAVAPAAAPATPPAAAPAKAPGKPGRPPKAKPTPPPAAAAPVDARKFFVGLEGAAYENAIPAATITEWLAKGMPTDTPLCLEGEDGWKTAADYGLLKTAAPAPVTPPPAAAPAAVAAAPAAAAPAGDVPPWGA